MISTRTRCVAAAAAATLLLGPLAGCGGDGKDASAGTSASPTPSASASSTAPAGTPVSVDKFLTRIAAGMADQKSVHMSIAGSSALQLEAFVEYGASPAIRLETTLAGKKVSMVIADGALYIQQPNGKFRKVPKNDPTYGGMLDSFKNFGPRGSVKDLEAGISKVSEIGTETVDGEQLTHYDVTVDTTKVVGSFQQLAGSVGTDRFVAMGFFLDSDGLLRQITVASASGQPIAMKFSDWGMPVDIQAPTGNQLASAG